MTSINVDVVIIGAGLSGLVAADNILKHNSDLKIVVLEAKDRIGGRLLSVPIKTNDEKICHVDLGGHWVSSEQILLLNLLKDLNLSLAKQCKFAVGLIDVGYDVFSYTDHPIAGSLLTKYELTNFFTKIDHLSENYSFKKMCKLDLVSYYDDSISMEYFIKKQLYSSVARKIATSIVKTSCGMETSKISLLNYLVFCNGTQGFTNQYMMTDGGCREFWIEEGAQEICNRIANKFDDDTLITRSAVRNIIHTNKYVLIQTDTNLYKCLFTIIAIPPKEILNINFTPALSNERYRILLQNQNTHLRKFAISYEEKFWEIYGCSGQVFNCGDGPILFCYDASVRSNAILAGYIKKNTKVISCKDLVIKQLVSYWGKDAENPIDYIEKNWCEEKYNGSCPTSRALLNNLHFCNKLVEPLGRIYWAGTETAYKWNGFMEGAIYAGQRASLEVLYYLRPQSITLNDVILQEYKYHHKKRIVGNWYLSLYNPYLTPVLTGTILYVSYKIYKKYY